MTAVGITITATKIRTMQDETIDETILAPISRAIRSSNISISSEYKKIIGITTISTELLEDNLLQEINSSLERISNLLAEKKLKKNHLPAQEKEWLENINKTKKDLEKRIASRSKNPIPSALAKLIDQCYQAAQKENDSERLFSMISQSLSDINSLEEKLQVNKNNYSADQLKKIKWLLDKKTSVGSYLDSLKKKNKNSSGGF